MKKNVLVIFMIVLSVFLSTHTRLALAVEKEAGSVTKYEQLDTKTLNAFDPLVSFGNKASTGPLATPADIINRFLSVFAFPAAGLILFVMLIWGGFEMLAGSATKKSMEQGRQRITNALLGFLLLFCAYWIARVIEFVFNINIV